MTLSARKAHVDKAALGLRSMILDAGFDATDRPPEAAPAQRLKMSPNPADRLFAEAAAAR
jgi:hypothetical protein